MNLDQKTFIRARLAVQEAVRDWIYDPNVRYIDFGWPEHGGTLAKDELNIRIHVIEKFRGRPALEAAIEEGKTRKPIPDWIAGFPVDKPEGTYRLQPYYGSWGRPLRARRLDPMKGGISISNAYQRVYGTLGGFVEDRHDRSKKMILSNWHVLAGDWWAQPGRPICQPGIGDGGNLADTVARLSHHAMSANLDAAVAELIGGRNLLNDQYELGPVKGVGWAQIGMKVCKSGRRTEITHGLVTAIEGTLRMNYRGVERLIRNVVTIEPHPSLGQVSAGGDSGSLWLEESTMRAVGLHFAGSDEPERALAIDIQPVLDALEVDLIV